MTEDKTVVLQFPHLHEPDPKPSGPKRRIRMDPPWHEWGATIFGTTQPVEFYWFPCPGVEA